MPGAKVRARPRPWSAASERRGPRTLAHPLRRGLGVDAPLNPTQRQVLDRLKRAAVEPAPGGGGYDDGLLDQLEAELADVVEPLGGQRIVISKHALASV